MAGSHQVLKGLRFSLSRFLLLVRGFRKTVRLDWLHRRFRLCRAATLRSPAHAQRGAAHMKRALSARTRKVRGICIARLYVHAVPTWNYTIHNCMRCSNWQDHLEFQLGDLKTLNMPL